VELFRVQVKETPLNHAIKFGEKLWGGRRAFWPGDHIEVFIYQNTGTPNGVFALAVISHLSATHGD
jgi:hypothetical protein